MKSERRHELQHNDLAEWFATSYDRIVPYRTAILAGGVLLVALLIGVSIWRSHAASQSAEAWRSLGVPVFHLDFANKQTLGILQTTVHDHPGTTPAEWATVFAGDTDLMSGANAILTDKKAGLADLGTAGDIYKQALGSTAIPAAREQALFGRARALESLIKSKTDLDNAVAAYTELNQSFPQGIYKAIAEQRIEQLPKGDALKFYKKLAEYTPKAKIESPHSELDKLKSLEPLPDNPPDTTNTGPSATATHAGSIPAPSLTPSEPVKSATSKTDFAKPPAANSGTSKGDEPKTAPVTLPSIKPDEPTKETPKPADTSKAGAPKSTAPKSDAPKKDK